MTHAQATSRSIHTHTQTRTTHHFLRIFALSLASVVPHCLNAVCACLMAFSVSATPPCGTVPITCPAHMHHSKHTKHTHTHTHNTQTHTSTQHKTHTRT